MRFLYIYFILFLTASYALLSGCTDKTEGEENELAVTDQLIQVSRDQFNAENMHLGNAVMHTFETVFKTNGFVTASPQSKANVYSYITGVISSIFVNPGSFVRKGQTLCTIESKEFINMQQRYLESLAKLKSTKANYERIKSLFDENISSQKDFLAIESEYNMLNARIQALRAEFKILRVNLKKLEEGNLSSYLSILSPIEGYITLQNCNIGQFVDSEELLMKIIDNRDLQLHFYVYQENVNKLKKGQVLKIYSPDDASKTYTAKVTLIGKSIDPQTKSIDCIAEPEEDLRKIFVDGMYFQVEVITSTLEARAVPSEAIITTGERSFVLVKEKEDKNGFYFRKEEITTGIASGGFTQVTSDKPLDDILVKGVYYFQTQ